MKHAAIVRATTVREWPNLTPALRRPEGTIAYFLTNDWLSVNVVFVSCFARV